MNQFYRALHMPPKRLLRKVMGEKELNYYKELCAE